MPLLALHRSGQTLGRRLAVRSSTLASLRSHTNPCYGFVELVSRVFSFRRLLSCLLGPQAIALCGPSVPPELRSDLHYVLTVLAGSKRKHAVQPIDLSWWIMLGGKLVTA
jgi:hypothetical protein